MICSRPIMMTGAVPELRLVLLLEPEGSAAAKSAERGEGGISTGFFGSALSNVTDKSADAYTTYRPGLNRQTFGCDCGDH